MPIIERLTDADFYKFTMGQVVFERYRDVPVRYALTNRTRRVRLAEMVNEEDLRRELDHVRTLRFTKSELHYLRGTNDYQERMFAEPYLQFLAGLELPPYTLAVRDGQFELGFSGKWSEAIYWETLALSIVNELYYRAEMAKLSSFEQDMIYVCGKFRLGEKIVELRKHPDILICDFGTRRRFSRDWQFYVDRVLAAELPGQFLGTADTLSATLHSLLPMGTSAHEMYMVMSGIMHASDDEILASHNRVLCDWWNRYGHGLSIALTDTYGSEFFFRDMTREQAVAWKGLRQDSGDPFEFGERAIAFYRDHGIDPREKLVIFSDGLDLPMIVALADRFRGRIKVSFGWGTNLTNDLGFPALSLVVKAVEADGHGTVKLSDNLAKATGTPEDVARFKRIFGHTVTASQECRY